MLQKVTIYRFHFVISAVFTQNSYPGRGGQTEVTPDHTSFERTHVPVALELHGLEKNFEHIFVWTMVWNLSDQGSLRSGTV